MSEAHKNAESAKNEVSEEKNKMSSELATLHDRFLQNASQSDEMKEILNSKEEELR